MEALYKIRLEIDGLKQLIDQPNVIESINQYEIHKSLRLAKGWITKIIKLLNPEENSLDILLPRVLPEDEEYSAIEFEFNNQEEFWNKKPILEKIDWLINTIDGVISRLPNYTTWAYDIMNSDDYQLSTIVPNLPNWQLEIDQVYIHLQEAKMFLGFELLNMKNNGTI